MMFAAVVGHRSGRATPSLRDAPQRQSMETVDRETIYRSRNAVQTKPATSHIGRRDHDALFAGESGVTTGLEKPLDLLVDPANRLDLAALIDRTGNGERL